MRSNQEPASPVGGGGAERVLTTSERWTILAAIGLGLLLLGGSFAIAQGDASDVRSWAWTQELLLNLGAAVLLVAPIEFFSARLRRRVAQADARQSAALASVRAETRDEPPRLPWRLSTHGG